MDCCNFVEIASYENDRAEKRKAKHSLWCDKEWWRIKMSTRCDVVMAMKMLVIEFLLG